MTVKTSMESFPSLTVDLPDEAATARLGMALAQLLRQGDILALNGDLGAGKTTLARSILRNALQNPLEDVPSPTFTLIQLYEAPNTIWWHFDLYRLRTPDDALELGIEDAFSEGISLIEWPERLGPWLPPQAILLHLLVIAEQARRAKIFAPSTFLASLKHSLSS